MTSLVLAEDFAALCREIDSGNDDRLPILADWLEENGDRRANALREVIRQGKRPWTNEEGVSWWVASDLPEFFSLSEALPYDVFIRLRGYQPVADLPNLHRYEFRSQAFLALAEAIL